tara:strand:+ start:859 stop:1173 length:315 start_codon:yes stop_codon:yes gene_type:complete
MDRELINKSKEILDRDLLDQEEQQVLNEISIGKLSSTMFIGRLKVLSRKIKDITLRKSIMTLGYLIYTVSLQSKSLKSIEDSLKDITQQLKNQNKDIEKLKTNK